MAQRFGGKYSPDGQQRDHRDGLDVGQSAPAAARQIRHPHESRTTWITIAAFPFLLGAFWQEPAGLIASLAGFGLIASGMWLTREGLQAQAAYDAQRVARRPAFPRKLFGGLLTGLGLAVGAAEPGAWLGATLIGMAGVALHWLAFGPDPMRDKGTEGLDPFQQDRVARMIDEGQNYLDGMLDAIQRTGDRRLEGRVTMFEGTVHQLFRQVEQNPASLSAARRYLGVYLMGARDATVKFADLYTQTHDPRAREDWENLLADLETNFAARTRQFIDGGRSDLDIEIEVLRDRLAREGVRPQDAAALPTDKGIAFEDLLRDVAKSRKSD